MLQCHKEAEKVRPTYTAPKCTLAPFHPHNFTCMSTYRNINSSAVTKEIDICEHEGSAEKSEKIGRVCGQYSTFFRAFLLSMGRTIVASTRCLFSVLVEE